MGADRVSARAVFQDAWSVVNAHPVALIAPGAALFLAFGWPAAILNEVDTDTGLRQVLLASSAQLLAGAASFLYYGYCEDVVRQARAGREVSVRVALADTGRVLPMLILGAFVVWLAVGVGLLLLILPGLWLMTRWALVSQAIAFEHLGLWRAIRRSNRLTKGNMRLVASTVVLAIVTSSLLAGAAGELGAGLVHDETVGRVVGAAAGQLLSGPFTGVVVATVYFGLLERERVTRALTEAVS